MRGPMQAAIEHLMACHGKTEDEAREALARAMRTDDDSFGQLQDFAKAIIDGAEGETRRMSARGIESPTEGVLFTFKGN